MKLCTAGLRPLIATLVVLLAAEGTPAAPEAAVARSPYWRERTSFFQTFGRRADVVMIGDSLTDGAEWREMFPGQDIVNRGIDGDTVDGVLARIDSIVSLQPRVAFVMIGINDFGDGGRSVDAVLHDYRLVVERLVGAGIRVVVQSTLPCNVALGAWKSCASVNGRIRQLNERLATLAAGSVRFVDLARALAPDGELPTAFTFDGVHLNGAGYRRWQATIAPYMPAARPPPPRKP
jgi:lysophospholipase L1-like esterase